MVAFSSTGICLITLLILVNDQSRHEDDHAPDERESCGVRLVAVADPFERRLHAGDCRVGEHEAEQEYGDRQWRGHRFLDCHIHQARSQEDERGDGAGHGHHVRAASFPVSDQRVHTQAADGQQDERCQGQRGLRVRVGDILR